MPLRENNHNHIEKQKDKERETCEENDMSIYVTEQSSSRVGLCSNCKCPDSRNCLQLKDSGQEISNTDGKFIYCILIILFKFEGKVIPFLSLYNYLFSTHFEYGYEMKLLD